MMIKMILKGVVMGLANIIPGVSGGTMAVSMGIYDKMIYSITHLFSEFKKGVLFLLPVAIGMVIAIGGSAFGIDYLFVNYPVQTNLLFIGLILGSLPAICRNVKGKKVNVGHVVAALVFFALVVGLALLDGTEGSAANLSFGVVNVLKLFGVGVIASATMVIPGVSGSMMLLLMGYYNPIITAIKDFIVAALSLDVNGILSGFGILIPFGIGVVAGIFAIAKLIEVIFDKFPMYAYWAIIGLIVASPLAIVIVGDVLASVTFINLLTGLVTLVLGFLIAVKLGD